MKEETKRQAEALCAFLTDHKGQEVSLIDVSEDCSWTDCFIICTVTSLGHLRGLAHEIWAEIDSLGLQVNNRHKAVGDDGWELIDCGDIVIHLMSQEMRDFYSLEKLWQKFGK